MKPADSPSASDSAAATRTRAELVALFEPGVFVAVWGVDVHEADSEVTALEPVERAAIDRAVEKRRVEFARGRACARAALVAAGGEPVAIPVGPNREPRFPAGHVGAITHCDGFVAAVVARGRDGQGAGAGGGSVGTPSPGPGLRGLGVDAERLTRLEADVLGMIVTDFERSDPDWARPEKACVLFSAKEAVFKAVFPVAGVWMGFEDVGLTVSGSSFRVGWASDAVDVPELSRVRGRWTVVDGLVLTGCWLT